MRVEIQEAIKEAQDLQVVGTLLCSLLDSLHKEQPGRRVRFVCGLISSEGREYIDENMKILAGFVDTISEREGDVVFSSADVFTPETYARVNLADRTNQEFINLWRVVLGSGHITDVHFTPRWERSEGARDEHMIATELGLTIHYET